MAYTNAEFRQDLETLAAHVDTLRTVFAHDGSEAGQVAALDEQASRLAQIRALIDASREAFGAASPNVLNADGDGPRLLTADDIQALYDQIADLEEQLAQAQNGGENGDD